MAPVEEFRGRLRAAIASWEIGGGKHEGAFDVRLRLKTERVDNLTDHILPVLEEVARAAFAAGKG